MVAFHSSTAGFREGSLTASFAGRLLLAAMLFSEAAAQSQTAVEAWVRRYNSGQAGAQDYAYAVVADADGNVIVAGTTDGGTTGPDILVIKYSGAGVPLWTNRYDGPGHSADYFGAVAVGANGNVFVTGES